MTTDDTTSEQHLRSEKRQVEVVDREAAPLPESYHKARRSYGLFAGLLIAWELIGIELQQAPFSDFKVAFKSPEAAPFVLVALVLYFMFRITVEWHQADAVRRTMKVSKIDFRVAHFLAVTALGIFLFQRLLNLQIADLVAGNNKLVPVMFSAFIVGFISVAAARVLILWWQIGVRWRRLTHFLRIAFLFLSVSIMLKLVYDTPLYRHESLLLFASIAAGVATNVALKTLVDGFRTRRI